MITERYAVRISIPTKSGARAEAEFKLDNGEAFSLSLSQAQEVHKALKTAAAVGEVELYVSIIQRTENDNYKAV